MECLKGIIKYFIVIIIKPRGMLNKLPLSYPTLHLLCCFHDKLTYVTQLVRHQRKISVNPNRVCSKAAEISQITLIRTIKVVAGVITIS
jgi:hypothetical protein